MTDVAWVLVVFAVLSAGFQILAFRCIYVLSERLDVMCMEQEERWRGER